MGSRSFAGAAHAAHAAVVVTGVQQRFGRSSRSSNDAEDGPPPTAQWRCNLTGLSQVHNLYFVAYSDKIYVYVPHFSTQALPDQPALIVTTQPSRPGLPGYLDPLYPHAVNNLVVQFLGREEVVAVVRDDGDIDAFLVRHVAQAIERRAEPGSSLGVETDEVRPILQSNVGMSAWGLAIHSNARIVATSANTRNITLFKFGLVGADDGDRQDEVAEDGSSVFNDRGMDVTQSVLNGNSNIPYIAFCNTGDDPDARWLLTSDVSGVSRSIDLHSMQPSQTFRFGRPMRHPAAHSFDPFNSGWSIMFLDRRSFIQEDSIEAALGLGDGETLPAVKETASIWDIGATVRHIPDTAAKFSASKKRKRPSGGVRSPDSSHPASALQSPQSQSDSMPAVESSENEEEGPLEEDDPVEDDISWEAETSSDDSDSAESAYYMDLDTDTPGTEGAISVDATYGGTRIYGNEPRAYQPHNSLCGDCPCPILHASVRNVYLLQPSNERESHSPFTPPTVGFTNALRQLVQGEFSYLNAIERLNMNAYIPAIGIVVLASQKGRALVLSLTKLSKSMQYPPEMQSTAFSEKKTKYAMKIERILPFAHQEEKSERPFAPLMGLAAGPMQGTEHLPEEKKRWRLMMMYGDHSVLSYEISRRRTRDSAVDIQGVVV